MTNRHNVIAYLATVFAITLLAVSAAAVCLFAKLTTEVSLARVIGALAFVSGAIQGLTGIAGTFKASQSNAVSEDTAKEILTKVPPTEQAK